MNFKEFDMSEYYNVLEEFKQEHQDKKYGNGSSRLIGEALKFYSENSKL